MSKPLVFVAAVYEGNASEFAHGLVKAARSLRAASPLVPVLPDLRLIGDVSPADRFEYEADLIARCDALVVIGGTDVIVEGGEGVDDWVDFAQGRGVPVFGGPGLLFEWVAGR